MKESEKVTEELKDSEIIDIKNIDEVSENTKSKKEKGFYGLF